MGCSSRLEVAVPRSSGKQSFLILAVAAAAIAGLGRLSRVEAFPPQTPAASPGEAEGDTGPASAA
jgi:hypothetical protein